MAYRNDASLSNLKFNKIYIGLASPEDILNMSYGEVTKPETINYRTFKPERDGLFCERIFGPIKDYECHCGKYKRIRYKGIICDRCGVEITEKKVRRERMGHITLVVPVAHIWFVRSQPNMIGALLGINSKKVEAVVYYERYIVINPGIAASKEIQKYSVIDDETYNEIIKNLPPDNQSLPDNHPDKFIAKMGAEALYILLKEINLEELSYKLRDQASKEVSLPKKLELYKRLQVVEYFRESNTKYKANRPEWMIIKVLPVIPPELRPLVPLEGGKFASSDLNDLYRRVIIRNNRLKKLLEIKAPEIILRNEKRMLQEAVDSLLDNSKKAIAVKGESNRPLKSLSDSLRGKQGRFRQNLLGKRIDYSARSVIVVGPELKLHECGLPKDIAVELYKPFIIRRLLDRGYVKSVKSAKKMIESRDPRIWDIVENTLRGHPVLLNRAPTLHRLSIQAFQPKLVEGKAIHLHPLVCTPFNADFDGDQMAVYLPLSNTAILEAQCLMLSSHNILNPSNGTPILVPSQDMVLGLYYMTKPLKSNDKIKVKGEGLTFYSPEEVIIAYNEKKLDLHAIIKVKVDDIVNGVPTKRIVETTTGRVIFNQIVPKEIGYINELLTKKSLRDIIAKVLRKVGNARCAKFLDDLKELGFQMAFKGGLSFNLEDVKIPEEKELLIAEGYERVEEIENHYNLGLITNNERYNQIIDVWTHVNNTLTEILIKKLSTDQDGFNPIFMMLDSGARGSREQIRQLCGMRGLMAKPQKSGTTQHEIIENPIISNFKEGLSVFEYFISTHGARKGLADTALKTADAGYLTRRLVDVTHDVVVTEEDCGTLRGIVVSAVKKGEEILETLYDRILGRVSLHDIYHPITGELIVAAGEEITEEKAEIIEKSPIEQVEVRSVLTCETKFGVCAKCYGRNLATGRLVKVQEPVGIIAAQSIGEPGTQLTLRTFHVGGTAVGITAESSIKAKYDGIVEFYDLKTVPFEEDKNSNIEVVVSRLTELHLIDKATGTVISTHSIPYGAKLYVKQGSHVKKGDLICEWDIYNSVLISEETGYVAFHNLVENINYREEIDEQTGIKEKVIIETRDRSLIPTIKIVDKNKKELKSYVLPVGAHLLLKEGDKVYKGSVLVKIPRIVGKAGDITGGLPRVTELFEARNPSNPALISEIDGEVQFGKIVRGSREITITSKTGEVKKYYIPLSKQILVQNGDYIKAGTPLTDGLITLNNLLAIKGPTYVQEYIINEIQEVYRQQGVKINDKHFEIVVRQMMRKVKIEDPGDTRFLPEAIVDKFEFMEENDRIYGKKVIVDPGDSEKYKAGQIIGVKELREENSFLKRLNKKQMTVRDAMPATASFVIQGITRAALQSYSFISAASFQDTTRVLTLAAVRGKTDYLIGLKENVIIGRLIPAGTGFRNIDNITVLDKEEATKLKLKESESLK